MATQYRPAQRSASGKSIIRYDVIDTSTGEVIENISSRERRNRTEAQAHGFKNLSEKQRAQSGRTKPELLRRAKGRKPSVYQFESIGAAIEYARHLNRNKVVSIIVHTEKFIQEYSRTNRKSGWYSFVKPMKVSMVRALDKTGEFDSMIEDLYMDVMEEGNIDGVNLWVHR